MGGEPVQGTNFKIRKHHSGDDGEGDSEKAALVKYFRPKKKKRENPAGKRFSNILL